MAWAKELIMTEKRIKQREYERKYRKYYPNLALNINNGMLLCKTHHNETHGWCLN